MSEEDLTYHLDQTKNISLITWAIQIKTVICFYSNPEFPTRRPRQVAITSPWDKQIHTNIYT